ncbi:hypothetical protein BT96DRAFT_742833, partial [Gymnopus androsaceus JB14]
GRQDRSTAHQSQQKLSKIEEDELFRWLKDLDSWDIHLPHKIILSRANDILAERQSSETVGKSWIRRFMSRYPQLKTALGQK